LAQLEKAIAAGRGNKQEKNNLQSAFRSIEIVPFPAFPQKMSSSTKLKDQSSAPKYSNGSSARSNPSHAARLPTAPFDRVTLTDIAADAGVSRATVSLVLRNSMSQLLAERRIFKPELIVRESCGHVSANQKDHS
jgi:hypothetical protein